MNDTISSKTAYLCHLYPEDMCIYGDLGNVLTMQKWLQKNNFDVKIININPKKKLQKIVDWYFIGGGADKSQYEIYLDMETHRDKIINDLNNNVPLLAICGGLQLLGKSFVGSDGKSINGLNYFDIITESIGEGIKSRSIGNIVAESIHSEIEGKLVGFENHGGQTSIIDQDTSPLAKVISGTGNNKSGEYEGVYKNNAIGCYLHGPCLAKNPSLLDYFGKKIVEQVERRDGQKYELGYTASQDGVYIELNKELLKRYS